jgi:Cft2 family RNA processing exonuclease
MFNVGRSMFEVHLFGVSVLRDVGMEHSGYKYDDFISALCDLCGELLPFG